MKRAWRRAGLAVALIVGTSEVAAQSSAELVALGDAAYKERRQKDALDHFVRSIAADATNYEALWKASRSEIDLAEIAGNRSALDALLASGQQHAEAAIRARPSDVEGHFAVARAVGRRALSVGVRDRIRFSRIIRDSARAALKIDSTHAGALHVLGMWNAEIMRVNGLSRMFARTFLGAEVFSQASWDEAQRLLEASVRHDPRRIIHQLDLAGIYEDRGDRTRARELYRQIASAPLLDPNDDVYKRQAAERLKRLPDNQSPVIQ
jgi:tetratricopeptide (TPR) repeat protein